MPKEVRWQVQPSRFSFSHRWVDQEALVCLYELIVRLLDAKQAKLHHFSPSPIPQGRTSIPFKVSLTGAKRKNGMAYDDLLLKNKFPPNLVVSYQQHSFYLLSWFL